MTKDRSGVAAKAGTKISTKLVPLGWLPLRESRLSTLKVNLVELEVGKMSWKTAAYFLVVDLSKKVMVVVTKDREVGVAFC